MPRYFFALIPGILSFVGFYWLKMGEANLLLRDFWRVSFLYLALALAVTPIVRLTKRNGFSAYRRTFGVLAFLLALAHAGIYFAAEYEYQKTFFVLAHFQEGDVLSGTVAFFIIAALGITSNDVSIRLLKSAWKKIQTFAYPLFLIGASHVAFASHFDYFYMTVIGTVVFLRTAAYLFRKDSPGEASFSRTLSIFISVLIITGWCFEALILLSADNRYTSVRKYTKPKPDLPIILERK